MKYPDQPWFRREGMALLTDFYELTMMAGYWKDDRTEQRVSFDYFFRSLPPHAGFGVAAGLDVFLDYLEHLRFEEDDLQYLRSLKMFDPNFLKFLGAFRPSCTVRAIAEGSLVFPFEPIVQIEGSIFEAQLIETALLNLLNYQTLIATKSARICLAANGESVMEFGLRRAHGPDGGLSGSRAAYIGGCSSTSNVLAGKVYGIPVSGTHAHSWVMSYPNELDAFRAFARHYPDCCVLLVDTYDTVKSGVPNAIQVFQEMRAEGYRMRPAIRLDSGDLAKLSKIAYRMMTEAGLEDPLIVGSNDLDEDLIADLKRQGAKINAWGVGTHLITAHDCPALNGVYKLVAVHDGAAWQPRMKISSNIEKATDPGRKQLVRYYDAEDHPIGDVIHMADVV
jgi:nicotinate phosphoribosyltransferase